MSRICGGINREKTRKYGATHNYLWKCEFLPHWSYTTQHSSHNMTIMCELSQCFAAVEVQKSTQNLADSPSVHHLSKQHDESSCVESGWHAGPRRMEMFGASIPSSRSCCCSVVGKLQPLCCREAAWCCGVFPAMSRGLRGRWSPAFMW